ncbi:MAG: (Fe-S)-binding protein, partial [Desulfatiglandales bacterium]
SLFMDILGLALLVGVLYFLTRSFRAAGLKDPKRTLLPLILLLLILVAGFLAEGVRLSIVDPGDAWSCPVGWVLSMGLPASPLLMQMMIRLHFFAVLVFFATLPFTFMHHAVTASMNVYYRRTGPRGDLRPLDMDGGPLGAATVRDLSWKQLLDAEACVSCGRCEENCPAFISGKPLSPQKVVRNIREQMQAAARPEAHKEPAYTPLLEDDLTWDEIWACTTCMACVEHCPVFIEPMDKIIDMRRYQVLGKGLLPAEAMPILRNLEIFGDVQGKGIACRKDWALGMEVPVLSAGGGKGEVLLWVGCSGAFHPRHQEIVRALVKILEAARVSFAILAKEELCCGDPARRLGNEALFLELAGKNIDRFRAYQVKRIVTLCPHCLNALKNEYPRLGSATGAKEEMDIEVLHATELVMRLIEERRIVPKYPMKKRGTIHDPCYLGRVNQIYEPPRALIRAVPELRLVELQRHREHGFCCGGGGGRMWLHEDLGRRISQIRAQEAVETGIDLLGTACPYCLTMLEDGIKALEVGRPPKVLDVIEIVASSIG